MTVSENDIRSLLNEFLSTQAVPISLVNNMADFRNGAAAFAQYVVSKLDHDGADEQ